jgi:hypothetical protein
VVHRQSDIGLPICHQRSTRILLVVFTAVQRHIGKPMSDRHWSAGGQPSMVLWWSAPDGPLGDRWWPATRFNTVGPLMGQHWHLMPPSDRCKNDEQNFSGPLTASDIGPLMACLLGATCLLGCPQNKYRQH